MFRPTKSLGVRLLGATDRQRMRVSQSLLGVPALLLIDALLLLEWHRDPSDPGQVAAYFVLTLVGSTMFYAIARLGLGERLSWREPSLSAPQMVFAMVCVAGGYALAGASRAALLCLMPLILCFGIFALKPSAARALSNFGIALMAVVMTLLAATDPAGHPPSHEVANWALVAASMAMMRVLADRLGQMRARLSAQKTELARALERIRLLATRDSLTGLLNRRAAQEELQRAARTAARESWPLTLALADLDHFKLVNDSYGHHTGDRVLQAFSRVAERELRSADRVARWGGEEFLFLLPATEEAEAGVLLDRVRTSYAVVNVEGVPATHALSFSAGVTLCHGPDDIDAAIERADQAMYSAKLAGRSRTHASESAESGAVKAVADSLRVAQPLPVADPAEASWGR